VGLCPLIALCFWFPQRHRSPDGGPCPGNVEEAYLVTVPHSSRQVKLELHKPLRVQFLPESREDILYPGGDRQQPVHASMAGGAQGNHQCGSSTRAWWRTIAQTHPWPQAWQIHPPRSMTKATSRGEVAGRTGRCAIGAGSARRNRVGRRCGAAGAAPISSQLLSRRAQGTWDWIHDAHLRTRFRCQVCRKLIAGSLPRDGRYLGDGSFWYPRCHKGQDGSPGQKSRKLNWWRCVFEAERTTIAQTS